jgi:galactokinase
MSEVIIRTHGRVNLIGDHTDYSGGWVLPTLIPQYTEVRLTKRHDRLVFAKSSEKRESTYELGSEIKSGDWSDYLKGVTSLFLTAARLKEQEFQGFSVEITSTIPEGSGLSSSAAFEMALLKAIKEAYALNFTDEELARLGQKVENDFVGARVGIMDQMAVAVSAMNEALYLDTQHLTYERIPIPSDKLDLLILSSGFTHQLSAGDGGYNQRRAECEEAESLLGVETLREMDLKKLEKSILSSTLKKRVRHVVSENQRVHDAVKALRAGNLEELGSLFYASHASLKNDFEVSIPAIDYLIDLCKQEKDIFGARLTGGGFGGSIVAITKKDCSKKIALQLLRPYQMRWPKKGEVLLP